MFIPTSIGDGLVLRLPQFFCCNCGGAQDVWPTTTLLVARRYWLPRSARLNLRLPYCVHCAKSARREPVGPVRKVLVATLLALTVGLLAAVAPLPGIPGLISDNMFAVAAAATFILVLAAYALQKPRGDQTSYYQPVRLQKVKRGAAGRIVALTLSFTHARYAEVFATANKEVIASGALQVAP
jgi:hypothetical protein